MGRNGPKSGATDHGSHATHAVDEDDLALFRQATRDVRPIAPPARAVLARSRPEPRARSREADDLEVLREMLLEPDPELLEHGETLQYRAQGVQDGVLRRLRRGHYRLDGELDLHGCNREQARRALTRFLDDAHNADRRCVRVIHGKGNRSPNSGPVLKLLLDSWLRRRKDVLAYCSARPVDGGTGAVYVLLRTA
ncbi:MAG: Smr/MutS family protein [Pseudomonadota bacterium]